MKARVRSLVVGSLLGMAFASTAGAGDEVGGATSVAVEPDGAGPCMVVHVAALGSPELWIHPMKVELARIWWLNGVDVRYPTAADPQGCATASARQVVVILAGEDVAPVVAKAMHVPAGAIAATVLRAPTDAARVHVFLERARRLVRGRTPAGEQMAQALLVARLAAHEIGHVLLGSSSHTRDGLMRATYTSFDAWAQPDSAYRLGPSDQAAVHRTLGGGEAQRLALRAERSPR